MIASSKLRSLKIGTHTSPRTKPSDIIPSLDPKKGNILHTLQPIRPFPNHPRRLVIRRRKTNLNRLILMTHIRQHNKRLIHNQLLYNKSVAAIVTTSTIIPANPSQTTITNSSHTLKTRTTTTPMASKARTHNTSRTSRQDARNPAIGQARNKAASRQAATNITTAAKPTPPPLNNTP